MKSAVSPLRRGTSFFGHALDRTAHGLRDPFAHSLADSARELARDSVGLAYRTGHTAQASLERWARASGRSISRQPVRAVALAAALGIGVALVLAARRRRS